jgi:hypothetical protein
VALWFTLAVQDANQTQGVLGNYGYGEPNFRRMVADCRRSRTASAVAEEISRSVTSIRDVPINPALAMDESASSSITGGTGLQGHGRTLSAKPCEPACGRDAKSLLCDGC